ncbi:type I toxin-antitoxin system Fst family toxin [Lactiplantibacillus plantarum]|nr:type I toxin-antitoxin system Fst family toxin [Lactiplantibacillus plantarum]MDG2545213.1 type I toxin-antitoxin system Fst family toxin [Lactiplantibacillus plantarum]
MWSTILAPLLVACLSTLFEYWLNTRNKK